MQSANNRPNTRVITHKNGNPVVVPIPEWRLLKTTLFPEFTEFRREEPVWHKRLAGDSPWYALPYEIIKLLEGREDLIKAATNRKGKIATAHGKRTSRIFPGFEEESSLLEAEKSFTDFCHKEGYAGAWGDYAIRSHCLLRGRNLGLGEEQTDNLAAILNGSSLHENREAITSALQQADFAALRMTAYVGWLLTNPIFVRERDDLKASLEDYCRRNDALSIEALFPLQPVPYQESEEQDGRAGAMYHSGFDDEEGKEILRKVARFMIRWELSGMDSWDLPRPQGPLLNANGIPVNLVPDLAAMGETLYIPHWYDMSTSETVLQDLREIQRRRGVDRCLKGERWPLGHHEAYAAMLHVVHFERAINRRLSDDSLRPLKKRESGLVTKALAEWVYTRFPPPPKKGRARDEKSPDDPAARIRMYRRYAEQRLNGDLPEKLR